MTFALAVCMTLYVLLHYVVVTWLTCDIVSRVDVLTTRMFTLSGTDIRLWWLVSALIVVLCLASHAYSVEEDGDGEAVIFTVLPHFPAVVGAWVLVWSGFGDRHGSSAFFGFFGNIFFSIVFAALILGSAGVIGTFAPRVAERVKWGF